MMFITQIKFVEEKRQKVIYEINPKGYYIQASQYSKLLESMYHKDSKARAQTFELGAKNLL